MYHYRESGLRNVWLANGYAEQATPYGPGLAIDDLAGLHHTIARGLVAKGGKLTGTELRFLRLEMELSQARLAALLGNEAQTVALWEKRGTQPKLADRFIRALWRERAEGNAQIMAMIERLVDADVEEADGRLTLRQGKQGWKLAA